MCINHRNYFITFLVSQKHQLETKASSHAGQCIPAGSSVSLPRSVLITMSIITMHSIVYTLSRKFCIRLFMLCKISTVFGQFFTSLRKDSVANCASI